MPLPRQAVPVKPGPILSARRTLTSLAAGLAVGTVAASLGGMELLPLTTWTVAATLALVWVWRIAWRQDEVGTKRLAEAESRTRTSDTYLLLAAVAGLVTVAVALVRTSSRQDTVAVISVLLSVIGVTSAWALVNTVFALKYARHYYFDEPDNEGIDFKQDGPPTYSDFAYMAFTIGMAFAVSDSEPTQTHIRKIALGHALLSYVFGTGLLAVAFNLVTNLG